MSPLMPITVDVVDHRGAIRARKPQTLEPQTELKTSATAQLLSQRATKRIEQANNPLLKVSISNFQPMIGLMFYESSKRQNAYLPLLNR
jgi:hypothetical protein